MRFGLYSEIQHHPGKTPERLFAEVLEQIANADRLGYDVYAVIEHTATSDMVYPSAGRVYRYAFTKS